MRTSAAGVDMIRRFEGFRATVYEDAAGLDTIGYGHLITDADRRLGLHLRTLTEGEATEILRADLARAEGAVNRLVTVPLVEGEFDALVSFVFNLGEGAFRGSTLLRKLNAGDRASVPAELARWTKAGGRDLPGLVSRREAEGAMFALARAELPETMTAGPSGGLRFGWRGALALALVLGIWLARRRK